MTKRIYLLHGVGLKTKFLNRYLSFNGGSEDGAGVKLTMRSIDTVLDENGKPISTKDLELKAFRF